MYLLGDASSWGMDPYLLESSFSSCCRVSSVVLVVGPREVSGIIDTLKGLLLSGPAELGIEGLVGDSSKSCWHLLKVVMGRPSV